MFFHFLWLDDYDIELFNKYLKFAKEDDVLGESIKIYIEWKEQSNNSSTFEKLTVSFHFTYL